MFREGMDSVIDVLIRLIGHINCFARAFLDCQLNRSDLLVDGLWHQRVVAAYEREQWMPIFKRKG